MSDEWTTVSTSPAVKEEEKIEYEIEGEEEEEQSQPEVVTQQHQVEEAKEEQQVTTSEDKPEQEEQQSGAQKRIRQLVRQKKEREERIEELIARQKELEEQLKSKQKEIETSVEKGFETVNEHHPSGQGVGGCGLGAWLGVERRDSG